jgi:CIC family chloride channel protein
MDKSSLAESTQRLSENARGIIQTAVLGSAAALSAVAFLFCTNFLFAKTFLVFAARSRSFFLISSFLTIMGFSSIVALLLRYVAPDAAGSGIPQLKAAYWKEMGHVEFRGVAIKFVAGLLSIAGGNSLGREGPSVYVGGGMASNLSGVFGVSRRERRGAVAIGAAASLAAAFNTPLAAITFVIEEIIGDFNSRYLGRVLLAAVLGAFVVHALIGGQPSFSLPTVESVGWSMYLVVPIAAALSGVAFQKGTLALRAALRG